MTDSTSKRAALKTELLRRCAKGMMLEDAVKTLSMEGANHLLLYKAIGDTGHRDSRALQNLVIDLAYGAFRNKFSNALPPQLPLIDQETWDSIVEQMKLDRGT